MTELVRATPGRPVFITCEGGGRIYVAVHDEYYRQTRKKFKERMRLTHPDMFPRVREVVAIRACQVKAFIHTYSGPMPALVRKAHTQRRQRAVSSAPFRKVREEYESWLKKEEKWYATYDLEPPLW